VSSKSKADPLPDGLHPQARIGIHLFNEGKYYPAHDHLELAWRDTPGEEGLLYKAVLQIGIAYYHIRRGNTRGALKMFCRARRNLAGLPEDLLGVNLVQLQQDARQVEDQLRQLGPEELSPGRRAEFPGLPLISGR
jgi:hypothetical protein